MRATIRTKPLATKHFRENLSAQAGLMRRGDASLWTERGCRINAAFQGGRDAAFMRQWCFAPKTLGAHLGANVARQVCGKCALPGAPPSADGDLPGFRCFGLRQRESQDSLLDSGGDSLAVNGGVHLKDASEIGILRLAIERFRLRRRGARAAAFESEQVPLQAHADAVFIDTG